jgi:hypothetical protein
LLIPRWTTPRRRSCRRAGRCWKGRVKPNEKVLPLLEPSVA